MVSGHYALFGVFFCFLDTGGAVGMWWMLGNRASGAKLVSLVKGLEFPHLGIGWLVLGKRMTYGDKKSRSGIACDVPFREDQWRWTGAKPISSTRKGWF